MPDTDAQTAQAAAVRATADLARAELPHLREALEALLTTAATSLEDGLSEIRTALADEEVRQALMNVPMILRSARATLRAKISAAEHTASLAPAAVEGEGA